MAEGSRKLSKHELILERYKILLDGGEKMTNLTTVSNVNDKVKDYYYI
jgi:hypothetical protein